MSDERSAKTQAPWGVNLLGHLTGNLGLAVAARNTLRMLLDRRDPVWAFDVDPGYGRGGHDDQYGDLLASGSAPGSAEAPYSINLFHLNPAEVVEFARNRPAWLDFDRRLNVVVPFWEPPRLPVKGGWHEVVSAVDCVLAPTQFVMDSVLASVPDARVVHYPQAVFLPEGVRPDRAAFGLPEDAVLFFTSFDFLSDPARKNPVGMLEAFSAAFPDGTCDGSDVHLVIKLNNSDVDIYGGGEPQRIKALLGSTRNAILLDETMSYERVLGLCASCDVSLSLHRAEGLGLNLLEAMSLGKPVIATAYSGNMDFMHGSNSCLVDYQPVPVNAEHPAYKPDVIGPDQTWAEPDLDEAVRWMRLLASDPEERERIGNRAAADMDALRARYALGEPIDRLKAIADEVFGDAGAGGAGAGSGGTSAHEAEEAAERLAARAAAWQALASMPVPVGAKVRRVLGKAARSLGLRK